MRRLAVLVVGLVVLLAACGGGKSRLTVADVFRHPDPGDVQVYFCNISSTKSCRGDATPAQEHAVETRLKRGSCVRQVIFVSKNVALSAMEKQNPSLGTGPVGLPSLPDEVVAVPAKSSCGTSIAGGLKAAHLRGVEKVQVAGTGPN